MGCHFIALAYLVVTADNTQKQTTAPRLFIYQSSPSDLWEVLLRVKDAGMRDVPRRHYSVLFSVTIHRVNDDQVSDLIGFRQPLHLWNHT